MAKVQRLTAHSDHADQHSQNGLAKPDREENFLNIDEAKEALVPILDQFGCVLEDLTATASGGQPTLHVVVDYATGTEPLSLDTIAEISGALSARLDQIDDGTTPYVLEVASAGANRSLTERRHWHRSVGRLLAINSDSGEKFLARLIEITDEGPQICRKKNTKKGQKESYKDPETLPWESISAAKVEIEFNH